MFLSSICFLEAQARFIAIHAKFFDPAEIPLHDSALFSLHAGYWKPCCAGDKIWQEPPNIVQHSSQNFMDSELIIGFYII